MVILIFERMNKTFRILIKYNGCPRLVPRRWISKRSGTQCTFALIIGKWCSHDIANWFFEKIQF